MKTSTARQCSDHLVGGRGIASIGRDNHKKCNTSKTGKHRRYAGLAPVCMVRKIAAPGRFLKWCKESTNG
jgi:hypothetical protein